MEWVVMRLAGPYTFQIGVFNLCIGERCEEYGQERNIHIQQSTQAVSTLSQTSCLTGRQPQSDCISELHTRKPI